jgi:hypothetical protein
VHSHKLTVASLLVLLVTVPLSLGVAACGGAGATAKNSTASQTVKRDRDNDADNNDDDAHILDYGHAPSATDREQLTSLVSRYYAAAAAEDGGKACSMLYPLLSETVAEEQNSTGSHRTACATAVTKIFKQRHQLLVGDSNTLKFYLIRVGGEKALTLVSFATAPEVRQLLERRVDGTWKIAALLDTILE